MITVREAFSHLIPDEQELEEFAGWAFGPYYRELDQGIDFMETWNYLHGQLLKLLPDGQISSDAPKMIEFWKKNRI